MNVFYILLLFIIAYLFGTVLYSRIYISLFREGNTVFYIEEEKKYWKVESFGTSNTAKFLGLKNGIIHFIIDFAKPIIFYFCILTPFQNYLISDNFTIIYLSYFFIILGNNYPIWWKFKGGDGIAAGVGLVFTISWLAGIIGFTVWIFFASISKHSGIGAFLGLSSAVIVLMFPSLYDTFFVYDKIIFDFWIILSILLVYLLMLIKQIQAKNISATIDFFKNCLKHQ